MTIEQTRIAVFGGTGTQGSAVVRSLLLNKDHAFDVRVITRDVHSPESKKLLGLGARLVCADARHPEQITEAFRGAWGAFINSNSDHHGEDDEMHLPNVFDFDIAVLDAAQAAGVRHVVYSSGANIHRATKGRVSLPGFDCKSYDEEYARTHGLFTTFTALLPASFMLDARAFLSMLGVQDDFGDIVHGIFLDPFRYDKGRVQAISTLIRFEDMAKAFTRAAGTPVKYRPLSSWTEVPQDGSDFRRECSLMFFYMNFCGGRWFAEHPSDDTAARECKEAAARARGCPGSALVTFEEWFRREFGSK